MQIVITRAEADLIIRTHLRLTNLLEESKSGIEVGRETACLDVAREELVKMIGLVEQLACLVSQEEE